MRRDDRSSFPLRHSRRTNTLKRKTLISRCINQSRQPGMNVHTKCTSSSLCISVTPYFFLGFLRALTLLPPLPFICISPLRLHCVSSSLLSPSLSPLSHSHAEGRARGSRYTKAPHTHTPKDTTGKQRRRRWYAESFLRVDGRCIIGMNLTAVGVSDGFHCSRNLRTHARTCVCPLVTTTTQ